MTLCGIFVLGIYSYKVIKIPGYSEGDIVTLLVIAAGGAFVGSHILYALVNFDRVIYFFQNPEIYNSRNLIRNQVYLVFGGSVFYGGLFGGIFAVCLLLRKKGNDLTAILDAFTPGIPLFHFFGRIGCFLAGCCFGIESRFGFTYHHSVIEEANNLSRFPVQLLEALINALLFVFLQKFGQVPFFKGKIIFLYLLPYSIFRFFLEFLRGDQYRGFLLFFSVSQWISLLTIIISVIKIKSPAHSLLTGTDQNPVSNKKELRNEIF